MGERQAGAAELRKFNYLSREIDGVYHDAARRLGLSDSALAVLYALWDMGGACPLGDICRRFDMKKQTLSSALRGLEEDGMVQVETLRGRRKRARLTEAGRALAKQTAGRVLAMEQEIFAGWTPEERGLYLDLTAQFLRQFREKVKELDRARL